MTELERPSERPAIGKYFGFDHVHLYCGNARTAASYYIARMGFEPYAYKGLETNSRDMATHVVKQGDILFAFSNSLNPTDSDWGKELMKHGDFVKDVAFTVDDCRAIYNQAIARGAKSFREIEEHKDENGVVITATIHTYGNVVHTFVERKNYTGAFMPGYKAVEGGDLINKLLPPTGLQFIDHVVGNMPDLKMSETVDFYHEKLDFHRFWTVDDTQVHTEFSALRSTVMCDFDRVIKMPINEPAKGKKKSQIQEYVEYYGGAGVQHVALHTNDIITTISNLRARGVECLPVPKTYYEDLRIRLAASPVDVKEDLDKIEELGILVDFDDKGYLLQLFSRPVEDRPTLFYEFIQRNNHEGFGAGNFKSLFESIERDQASRGNLTADTL